MTGLIQHCPPLKVSDMLIAIADINLWNKINEHFDNRGGIYKVIAVKDDVPVTINRFLGSDKDGVLYIGKALSYLDRVINLKKSTAPKYKSSNHEFGVRYKQHPSIKIHFPFETLYVKLEQSDTPDEYEYTELRKYFDTFGELPPLNRQEGKTATNSGFVQVGQTEVQSAAEQNQAIVSADEQCQAMEHTMNINL